MPDNYDNVIVTLPDGSTRYAVTTTERDGQPAYTLSDNGQPVCTGIRREDVDWFAALLTEAPYFLTGPTPN